MHVCFLIREKIEYLKARCRAVHYGRKVKKEENEMLAVISSRSLFALFVDRALWVSVNTAEIVAVRAALKQCKDVVRINMRCRESIRIRCDDFEGFLFSPYITIDQTMQAA